jgi:hypothetical protein
MRMHILNLWYTYIIVKIVLFTTRNGGLQKIEFHLYKHSICIKSEPNSYIPQFCKLVRFHKTKKLANFG